MTWKFSTRVFVALGALLVIVAFGFHWKSKLDAKSMEPLQFTQCFDALDTTDPRMAQLHKDVARNCVGQAWSIPRAYLRMDKSNVKKYPYVKGRSTGVDEDIELDATAENLTPAVLDPKVEISQTMYFVIKGRPLGKEPFADIFDRNLKWNTKHFQRTDMFMFGMRVYIDPNPEFDWGNFWLIPDKAPEFYLECSTLSKISTFEHLKSWKGKGCHLTGHIDDRIQLNYFVTVKQLENINAVHEKVATFIRSFIRN